MIKIEIWATLQLSQAQTVLCNSNGIKALRSICSPQIRRKFTQLLPIGDFIGNFA